MRSLAETLRGQFERLVEEGPRMAREAREVSITESSRDGLVKVTVDARGSLLALDLDPRIYRRPDARSLAESILETIRRATDAAQERVLDIFEPAVSRDDMRLHLQGTPDQVVEDVEDRLNRREGL
ncbi:YbaB/EbfC family nucleoid-associated protein [Cumulibacter manganitolerans]|uniref:YbaB/EbfC family nucleoid-associated protein n=1 Tax=Cumulibacter manganitolerans TaxID=1884992 RepID=UPI0012968AB4|nr:YbaB/EbfC family nucleoid-associated protein [Cumulibacter manganitolerans]